MDTNLCCQSFFSGKYSDLKFVCEGQTIKVHKVIVCVQSRVLDRMVNSDFEEATSNVINMDNFDIETVRRLVTYLYTRGYEDEDSFREFWNGNDSYFSEHFTEDDDYWDEYPNYTEVQAWKNVQLHLRMSVIAHYYDIPKLGDISYDKMHRTFEVLQYRCEQSSNQDWDWDRFMGIIQEARDNNGDTRVHEILSDVALQRLPKLAQNDKFKTLLEKYPDFDRKLVQGCAARVSELQDELATRNKELEALRKKHAALQKKHTALQIEHRACAADDETWQEFRPPKKKQRIAPRLFWRRKSPVVVDDGDDHGGDAIERQEFLRP